MQRLLNRLAIFMVILIFYIVSTGSLRIFTLLFGVAISIAAAVAVDKLLPTRSIGLKDAVRVAHLLRYLTYFIYTEMKSHVDMVRTILLDGSRIRPAIVAIPYTVESDYSLTFIALSITNTPGTLVLHVDRESRKLYVHWINATSIDGREARRFILDRFEDFAKKIFE